VNPVAALLAALCLLPTGSCGGDDGPRQRIVLITLDTLRWDAFAGTGDQPGSMPNLTRLGSTGTVFDRYYSATSTTQPTHATLFTGLHPWQHGVPFNGALLVPQHETVAERLSAAGYRTAGVIASFPVHSQFGWDQCFDVFRDDFTQGEVDTWSGVDVEAEGGFFSEASHVADQALELLGSVEGPRQFFWFHMYDPHAPYGDSTPGQNYLSPREITQLVKQGEAADAVCARARRAYDHDVAYMDAQLGRIFERLEQDDGFVNHVVVVSDHGESFGEGGSLGHGKRLTPDQVHVPLVIHSPRVAPGVRDNPVGTLDVNATLLAMAGIEDLPAGARDLAGELRPQPVMGMRRTWNERYVELRLDGRKVVIQPEDRRFFLVDDEGLYVGGTGGVSLEDSEQPLADGEKAGQLQELFAGFAEDFNAVGYMQVDTDETQEKLRAMGYIGDDEDAH
jgi:arylsulfatase A-like enzyme